jgi:hypothetical protein
MGGSIIRTGTFSFTVQSVASNTSLTVTPSNTFGTISNAFFIIMNNTSVTASLIGTNVRIGGFSNTINSVNVSENSFTINNTLPDIFQTTILRSNELNISATVSGFTVSLFGAYMPGYQNLYEFNCLDN